MRHMTQMPARQRGAALAIGLILLLVLTILAVSGMNTASMELVMAGNEQFRQRAFHASETGLELAIADLPTVPQTGGVVTRTRTISGATTTDAAVTDTQYMGDDFNITGYSYGKFLGLNYQIVSTGTSSRNSQAGLSQGAYVISNAGSSANFGSILPPAGGAPTEPTP